MSQIQRRTALKGAGAAAVVVASTPILAACASDTGSAGPATTASSEPTTDPTTDPTTVTIAAASVPVGGGVIEGNVVVTQPAEGRYKAFNAVCPHQGCTVDNVADDVISCPCHGSTFNAADGAKISGPAPTGLTAYESSVEGDDIVVTI